MHFQPLTTYLPKKINLDLDTRSEMEEAPRCKVFVNTVYTIQIALHCLKSSIYAYTCCREWMDTNQTLMTTSTRAPTVQLTLKFLLIKILNTLKAEIDNDKDRDRE